MTTDPDRLLEIEEAADLLQVKKGTLYSWVSKGTIPFRKVGSLVRFHRGELLEWTKRERQEKQRRTKLRVIQ
jgi:excisionase family DNA binding protein